MSLKGDAPVLGAESTEHLRKLMQVQDPAPAGGRLVRFCVASYESTDA